MLRGAKLDFEIIPADIDETTLQQSDGSPADIAQQLAQQKALFVAQQNPNALVIGSDQVLEFEEQLLSKSENADEAIDKLKAMSGKTHTLISAATLAKGDQILWSHTDQATMTMNHLTKDDLLRYKQTAGEALTASVGGYWLEDIGAWLFQSIQGDYFTILGMPLLPLLHELRTAHTIGWTA